MRLDHIAHGDNFSGTLVTHDQRLSDGAAADAAGRVVMQVRATDSASDDLDEHAVRLQDRHGSFPNDDAAFLQQHAGRVLPQIKRLNLGRLFSHEVVEGGHRA